MATRRLRDVPRLIDRRFQLQNYDSDTLFGQGDNPGQITASLFRMTNIVSGSRRMRSRDSSRIRNLCPATTDLEAVDETAFSADQVNATFVRTLGDWVPAQTISNIVGWVAQRKPMSCPRFRST